MGELRSKLQKAWGYEREDNTELAGFLVVLGAVMLACYTAGIWLAARMLWVLKLLAYLTQRG
jgi:hypothetical protein